MLGRELPLGFGDVTLVSDDDDGNRLGALSTHVSIEMVVASPAVTHQMIQNFVADDGDHLEALGGSDAVDE